MVVSFSSLVTSNSEAPHTERQQRAVSDDGLVDSGKGRDSGRRGDLAKHSESIHFHGKCTAASFEPSVSRPHLLFFIMRSRWIYLGVETNCSICIENCMWLLGLTLKHRVILESVRLMRVASDIF